MKYFSELSKIESEIIKLETTQSLVRMLSDSAGNQMATSEDITNVLHIVDERLQSIYHNLNSEFQHLWETVREDSQEKPKKGKK